MSLCSMIAGTGAYLPRRIVTNDELAQRLDTSDAWIVERTGIRQRHIAGEDETAVMMGTMAARAALENAGASVNDVDVILVATATPDQQFPACAVRIQHALGCRHGFGMDLSAACSGFIYGLSIADALIQSGKARGVLLIGSEVYSRIVDWNDRGTCVLFGDGAGAAFIRAAEDASRGILSTHIHSDGQYGDLLYINGAVGQPGLSGHLFMNGREIFRHAVSKLAEAVDEALRHNNLTHADIDWLVPHQANRRIIEGVGRKLRLPEDRVVITVDRHANTSAASIPLALNEARRDGRIKDGDLVILEALGGGLTWGSALVRM